jgi:hypothetical protein
VVDTQTLTGMRVSLYIFAGLDFILFFLVSKIFVPKKNLFYFKKGLGFFFLLWYKD